VLIPGRWRAVLAAAGVAAVVSAGTAPAAVAAPGPGVFAFGSNEFGGLGDGTTADSYSPVPVSGLPGPVRQIAAGGATSAALLSDGTVWAWGDNTFGLLGTGASGGAAIVPQPVPGGYLGDGTATRHLTPEVVPSLTGITQVSASDASFAVRSDGTLFAWGANNDGVLGNGTPGGAAATSTRRRCRSPA